MPHIYISAENQPEALEKEYIENDYAGDKEFDTHVNEEEEFNAEGK